MPFERPEALAGRSLLTDEEFTAGSASAPTTSNRQCRLRARDCRHLHRGPSWVGDLAAATLAGARSRVAALIDGRRSSGCGRIPPLTPEARRRVASVTARGSSTNGPFAGPEDLSLWDRCITRGLPSVIFPTVYNANARIVQSPGYLAITYEMIHETRVIPLDKSSHVSPEDSAILRRLARPMGRRHARRRRHEFHEQSELSRIGRDSASDRTLQAHRREHAALRGDLQRSRDLTRP